MKIPIFKLEFEKEFVQVFREKAEEILTSNRPIGENKYVAEFEEKFANFIGAKYAVAVTNGTVAIELALKSIGVEGKSVILPSNTFFATSVAVTNAGGKIELVDAEEESFSIDPDALEEKIAKISKSGNKVGAVIIVHIGGIISKNIEKILEICDVHNIPLVEDAAHAHGSRMRNFRAGTIGEVGCFSFFPTKVMTTAEGGMVTTNDKNIYELVKSLKNFGRDNDNIELCINPNGNNFKITEFTGLLGSMECDRVENRITRRNELTNIYTNELRGSGYKPVLQKNGLSSQYKMILRTQIEREWLRDYCRKHSISLTGEVYKIPVHQQPLYKDQFKNEKFPVTDKISMTHICPPLYPELTNEEVKYICKVLLQAEKEYEK